MRNYYNGGDGENRFDFESDNDNEEGGNQGDVEINIEADLVGAMELDLAEVSLNQQLLDRAILLAKEDWKWWFRKPSTKLKRIEKIYKKLVELTALNNEE